MSLFYNIANVVVAPSYAESFGMTIIEGMACEGGCINGAGVISHSPKDKMTLDQFAKTSEKESINMSVGSYETKF